MVAVKTAVNNCCALYGSDLISLLLALPNANTPITRNLTASARLSCQTSGVKIISIPNVLLPVNNRIFYAIPLIIIENVCWMINKFRYSYLIKLNWNNSGLCARILSKTSDRSDCFAHNRGSIDGDNNPAN